MIPDGVGPLSRPISVRHLPLGGVEALVEASDDERRRLAADFGLVALHRLEGRFRITGSPQRIRVKGLVSAALEQTCVVTLDPFASTLEEDVDVEFIEPHGLTGASREGSLELDTERDVPDEIVDGRIDLGSLTAEFLALGLDPHPRKPDAAFASTAEIPPEDHPFAALAKIVPGGE